MAHSGHSGGPVLGPRGEIVGWVVWTVGPLYRPLCALNYLRRDYIIAAGVDQLRPVDARFVLALSAALDVLLPATISASRYTLATALQNCGGRILP